LNKNLPPDIAIFEIIPVEENQHARFDATQRTYDYFIHTYKDPFLHKVSALYLERNLNIEHMKAAVSLLPRYTDFRAFCKSPDEYEHTLCNVRSATLFIEPNGDRLRFQISANRFLGRMIRIIVGKLLEIGSGKLSLAEFEHFLVSRETPKTIEPAYPQGLYLSKVDYPYLDIAPRKTFSAILQNNVDEWQII
jgi:tRNA pseudouridine38-40 synthase